MTIEENKNGLEPVDLGIDHKPSQEDIMIIDKTFIELLIVEDNEYKLKNTVEYIQRAAEDFPKYLIDYRVAKSFIGAKRLIKETKFDGYIIDMQLCIRQILSLRNDTFSCYFPVDGRSCGECGSCLLKRNALGKAGL